MPRNKMCPICYVKRLFSKKVKIVDVMNEPNYDNGLTKPVMGWSSWNCFANNIDEKQLYDVAEAIVKTGLADAGYRYVNIDDCWQANVRDENGKWISDYQRFPKGIDSLIARINALGLKVGMYSSNGSLTCEDLPASLGREREDALTVAEWGAEFFKYDFCHHETYSPYAPLIAMISIAKLGSDEIIELSPDAAHLEGYAKIRPNDNLPKGVYVSGLDKNGGSLTFENVSVEEEGEYSMVLTYYKYGGKYSKYIMYSINGGVAEGIVCPPCKKFFFTARVQAKIRLKKGNNVLKFFNPVTSQADGAMLQYRLMGRALKEAAEKVAKDKGQEVKPIAYSICEWGWNRPYLWGASAGNQWRTTPDIKPFWPWIVLIYKHNLKLYKYAVKGGYNDPDMLEVGNGKLTEAENRSHFSLWCMMNVPLVLGNDVRKMIVDGKVVENDPILKIVSNRELIAIDQDELSKPCKKVKGGAVDVLAKPLKDGVAICFFNKSSFNKKASFDLKKLVGDEYVALKDFPEYKLKDLWTGEEKTASKLTVKLGKHASAVYKIVY